MVPRQVLKKMAGNQSCQLGRWPTALLESNYVKAHDAEWITGGCCMRRNVQHNPPDVETTLRPNSLRLLFVVVADSRNRTRALAVSNIAAVSQLREATGRWLVLAHDSETCVMSVDLPALWRRDSSELRLTTNFVVIVNYVN